MKQVNWSRNRSDYQSKRHSILSKLIESEITKESDRIDPRTQNPTTGQLHTITNLLNQIKDESVIELFLNENKIDTKYDIGRAICKLKHIISNQAN